MIPKLQCSHCTRDYSVKRGSFRYCSACEKRFALKDITRENQVKEKIHVRKQKEAIKKARVTCWHCDYANQKIISFDKGFDCDKCGEFLWIGDGGYTEKKMGVYT